MGFLDDLGLQDTIGLVSSSIKPIDEGIRVKISGEEYVGWESISISRSMLNYAGEFSLKVSLNILSEDPSKNIESGIIPKFSSTDIILDNPSKYYSMGDEVEITFLGIPMMTGYIDEMPVGYDKDNYTIEYKGRDKTADLVDCTIDIGEHNNEFLGVPARFIIEMLCEPFDITVEYGDANILADLSNPLNFKAKWSATEGDSIHTQINRILHMFGAIAFSTGNGNLHIARPSSSASASLNTLVQSSKGAITGGINILSASFNQSDRNLHRKYIAKGIANTSNISLLSKEALKGERLVKLFSSKRDRTFTIIEDDLETKEQCEARAEQEARQRVGAGRSLTVKVQDWQIGSEGIWEVNTLTDYIDPMLAQDGQKLVVAATYELSNSGSSTSLTLAQSNTFIIKKEDVDDEDVSDLASRLGSVERAVKDLRE